MDDGVDLSLRVEVHRRVREENERPTPGEPARLSHAGSPDDGNADKNQASNSTGGKGRRARGK